MESVATWYTLDFEINIFIEQTSNNDKKSVIQFDSSN